MVSPTVAQGMPRAIVAAIAGSHGVPCGIPRELMGDHEPPAGTRGSPRTPEHPFGQTTYLVDRMSLLLVKVLVISSVIFTYCYCWYIIVVIIYHPREDECLLEMKKTQSNKQTTKRTNINY